MQKFKLTIGIITLMISLILMVTINSCTNKPVKSVKDKLDDININKGSVVLKIIPYGKMTSSPIKIMYLKDSSGKYNAIYVYEKVAELFSVGDTL